MDIFLENSLATLIYYRISDEENSALLTKSRQTDSWLHYMFPTHVVFGVLLYFFSEKRHPYKTAATPKGLWEVNWFDWFNFDYILETHLVQAKHISTHKAE